MLSAMYYVGMLRPVLEDVDGAALVGVVASVFGLAASGGGATGMVAAGVDTEGSTVLPVGGADWLMHMD